MERTKWKRIYLRHYSKEQGKKRRIKCQCLVNHNVFNSLLEFHSLTKSQVSQNAKHLTERISDPLIACSKEYIFILFIIFSTFISFPYSHEHEFRKVNIKWITGKYPWCSNPSVIHHLPIVVASQGTGLWKKFITYGIL